MEASFDRLLGLITEHFCQLKETGASDPGRVMVELDYLQDLMIALSRTKSSVLFSEDESSPDIEKRSTEQRQTAIKLRVLYELVDDFKAF